MPTVKTLCTCKGCESCETCAKENKTKEDQQVTETSRRLMLLERLVSRQVQRKELRT